VDALSRRHERANGAARVKFKLGTDGRTVLGDLYQRAPCRVLFPSVERDERMQAVLLTTSGGLTGGDRTDVQIDVASGAEATVTTQAAEKLYRALSHEPETSIQVGMTVGESAWAEWLAQETIVFEGARLRREFRADLQTAKEIHGREPLAVAGTRASNPKEAS